jgi:hypothetical protein
VTEAGKKVNKVIGMVGAVSPVIISKLGGKRIHVAICDTHAVAKLVRFDQTKFEAFQQGHFKEDGEFIVSDGQYSSTSTASKLMKVQIPEDMLVQCKEMVRAPKAMLQLSTLKPGCFGTVEGVVHKVYFNCAPTYFNSTFRQRYASCIPE